MTWSHRIEPPPRRTLSEPVQIRVIVAEPSSKFRSSVVTCLANAPGIDVAAVGTSEGLVRACASRAPDVALLVIDLPPDGGLSTVERLRAVAPDVQVIVWGHALNGDAALVALRAGARGVLERDISAAALVRCVSQVASGQTSLPRHLVEHVINELQSAERRGRAKFELAGLSSASTRSSRSSARASPNRESPAARDLRVHGEAARAQHPREARRALAGRCRTAVRLGIRE